MTKRNFQKFKRNKKDFYKTPKTAVIPLVPHLQKGISFVEPCFGEGDLANALVDFGYILKDHSDILSGTDALGLTTCNGDCFITNPPWNRKILHPLIENLSNIAPTWLLFDADWMHTKQSIPFLPRLIKIVSIGRISWMGNNISGFDNCAWYLFDLPKTTPTIFVGRT